ncbi:hypothetical protein [Draconibacterium sediminis]|uniref:hypothetical protein n=1 Tax=Draconibacterium sediminis TaxID=1544798 RepID=UPI0026EFEA9D|nr:hypothetical protein [Draconibacterium sediminis]
MIKLRAILIISLLCFLLPVKNTSAQAEVKHYTAKFSITEIKTGVTYEFDAPANEVITPSGNFVKSLKITVEAGHPLMQDFGGYPNRWFEFNYLYIDNGNDGKYTEEDGDVILTEGIAKLNKSGNLTIQFHLNGAGTYLPLGW